MGVKGSKIEDMMCEPVQSEGNIEDQTVQYGYAVGKGRRKYMEDYVKCEINYQERLVPHLGFFAVFDGHGGNRVAEHLEKNFLDVFMATAPMNDDDNYLLQENIEKGLNESYLTLDDDVKLLSPMLTTIKRRSLANPMKTLTTEVYRPIEATGSTASTVVLTPKIIVVAHAGDSRVIVVRNGEVVYSTIDHHPTVPGEKERIELHGGEVRDNRVNGILAVSRALGDGMFKEEAHLPPEKQLVSPVPEIRTLERNEKDDYILLASDGLW
eukprot:CAMPEP_0184019612 /NCGR_PEP_ID=MMETSP0954-20121128/8851_1 /TAXON_ID=627963 /ORGANISM="Aplanochytrium sp, Strain PBS07" /LENGTH=267 /DNA_ID=CAMNT_0026301303 /DNA_START=406 /DNA_END=1206 /DNA_ORIENTATION=-